jgi:hypothetical protein
MAACAAIAALMAILWLKPVTRRAVEGARREQYADVAGATAAEAEPAPARAS